MRGLDGYAGASVYCGLTLVALGWVLDALGDRSPDPGSIGADTAGVVSILRGEAQLGLVRSDDAWFAVKRSRSRGDFPKDLRYDFGLAALKAPGPAGWADLMPIRPRTDARREPRDRAAGRQRTGTPTRRADAGRRRRDGADRRRVPGRGRHMAPARRGVPLRAAAGGGVRLRIPAEAGDLLEYSVFFRGDPQSSADAVSDGELRASSDALTDVAFEDGYASGAEPKLVRARMALDAAAAGAVTVTIGPA